MAWITLFFWWYSQPDPPNPFFADLLADERPDMVVLGDMFVYREYDSLRQVNRSVRYSRVNSREDFERSYEELQRPGIMIEPRGYTFLISNASDWVRTCDHVFTGQQYTLRLRTDLRASELREYDFLVVGMIKTIGPFDALFSGSRLQYSDYDELTLTKEDGTTNAFSPMGSSYGNHTDYGIIARYPGPNGNAVQLFSGIWDSATSYSLNLCTEPALRKQLEDHFREHFGELPEYYELLFKVNGDELTGLSHEIIYSGRISPNTIVW